METTRVHASGTFKPTSWDEKPYAELEGAPKLTHAHVTNSYVGDIEGEGTSDSLMFYGNEGTATHFGFERVVGRRVGRTRTAGCRDLGGRRGHHQVVRGTRLGDRGAEGAARRRGLHRRQ